MEIVRIDATELDLDLADAMAALVRDCFSDAELPFVAPVGPTRMLYLQHGWENRPTPGIWVARDGDAILGEVEVQLPWRDNAHVASMRGYVAPAARRRGIGAALLAEVEAFARAEGRTLLSAGWFHDMTGEEPLHRWGFTPTGSTLAIRRLDLHETPSHRWTQLHDEAAGHASDYELIRIVGPTPEEHLAGLRDLHEAINDAPATGTREEPDAWDVQRVRDYDAAMAARRQTVHRVLARHRDTGEWAGMSMLCVDEFLPSTAFQEDTNVVRAHRGHRLGLLMKADLMRWIAEDRPEVAATQTWNTVDNHHMIAVNERLGCRVIAHHSTCWKDLT